MAKKIFATLVVLIFCVTLIFYHPGNQKAQALKESKEQSKETVESHEKIATNESKKVELPGKRDDWNLVLVNNTHEIKKEPTDLVTVDGGKQIDRRIEEPFKALMTGAKDANIQLTVISGYRSVAEQTAVVNESINSYINQGISEEEAKKKTYEYMTIPGHSEHHTGLAVDVLESGWNASGKGLEENFSNTDAGKWLDEHVADYGFVIRYTKGKEKITEINYEPWHLRYVGKENAKYMTENHLVLEEYVNQLKE